MFCSDMSPAFISGITEQFPGSSLTFDKFHVMKMANEAVDQVRREEQHHNAELKNTALRHMVWVRNALFLYAQLCELCDSAVLLRKH